MTSMEAFDEGAKGGESVIRCVSIKKNFPRFASKFARWLEEVRFNEQLTYISADEYSFVDKVLTEWTCNSAVTPPFPLLPLYVWAAAFRRRLHDCEYP